MRKSLISVKGK